MGEGEQLDKVLQHKQANRAHIDSPECKLIKEREQVEMFREELARCRAAPR